MPAPIAEVADQDATAGDDRGAAAKQSGKRVAEPASGTEGAAEQGGQLLSSLLVKGMFMGIIPSFGFTAMLLLFYTGIRDLMSLFAGETGFLADPVDAIISPGKIAGASGGGSMIPAPFKSPVRLFGRLFFIYPIGLLAAFVYLSILILIILLAYAIAHPGEALYKLIFS